MAPLPQVPRRLVTTEQTRSRVTAADAAGPFRMMADALGSFAPGLRDLEEQAGAEAGLQAVTTGPDGLPQLSTMPPMLGDYAAGYTRAARLKYLADLAPAVENRIHQARLEHANDPSGFQAWAANYGRELARREKDPILRASVDKLATRAGAQAWRAVSTEHFKRTVTEARTSLEARRQSMENQLAALARSGGTGTEEYAEAIADYDAIGDEFTKNPVFGDPPEEVARERGRMLARHEALATVGMVARVAADKSVDADGNPVGGPLRAKTLADNILTDPELDLTEQERRSYHQQAIAEIRQLSSANRALVSTLSTEANSWVKAIEGGDVDQDSVSDFLDRAAEAGAAKAVARVTNAISRQTYLRGWFDKLPKGDRARAIIELQGRGGGDREVAAIIGAESGGDPTARAATSSAAGLGQFIAGTWLDLVKRHAPEVAAGRSDQELLALRTDPNFVDLNRRMVGVLRDENRAALQAAGVPADSGAVYLAHFLGAADAIKVLGADPDAPLAGIVRQASIEANRSIFDRNPTAKDLIAFANRKVGGVQVPAGIKGDPVFLNAVRKRAREDLSQTLPKIEARVKAGEQVDAGELDELGALVYAVGDDGEKRRVVEMAVIASVGEQLAGMSAQEREAAGAEFAERFANGSTQLESEIGAYVGEFSKKIAKAYKDDPYDAAVRHGGRKATPPVDFTDPAALDAALDARRAERRFIREHEGIDPGTLLRPAEAGALRGALLGNDPATVARAAAVASNLLASNPHAFEGVTGKAAIEKEALKFRHYVDDLAMPAADAAARIVMERTPEHQAKIAAKVKGEDVDKIVNTKLSMADIRKAFDTSLWPGRPQVGFVLEGPAGLERESRIGMYGDYVELFREHYAELGDVDTAKKLAQDQLKRVWGTTSVNGSETVMRYPPEQMPALAGIENAGEVVAAQAMESILAETGERVERGSLRLLPLPGLTAAAFKSGQPVPYQLGWLDANGLPHWLPPGRAFVVDADGAREQQTASREAAFRAEQEIQRLDPAGRLGARLGIRVFGD